MEVMATGEAIAAASSICPMTAAIGPHFACIWACIHRMCGMNHIQNRAGPRGQPCWVPSCDSNSAHAVQVVPVPVSAPPRLVLLVALGLELELALPLASAGCVHLMPVVSGAPGPRRAHTKGSRRRSLGGASANRPGRRARWNWLKAFRRSICQQAKSGRRSSSALMPNTSFSTDAVMPTATWSGPR